jgi:hypothetical protein
MVVHPPPLQHLLQLLLPLSPPHLLRGHPRPPLRHLLRGHPRPLRHLLPLHLLQPQLVEVTLLEPLQDLKDLDKFGELMELLSERKKVTLRDTTISVYSLNVFNPRVLPMNLLELVPSRSLLPLTQPSNRTKR